MTGCDYSEAMLAEARRLDPQSTYVLQDALALGFASKTFDMAICINAINHMASHREPVAELCRVARRAVLGVPNRHSLLALHYVVRWPRRLPKGYGGFTFRKYSGRPLPYSVYFTAKQLRQVLVACGMTHTRCAGGLLLPLAPSLSPGLWARADRAACRLAGRVGTFLVVVGDETGGGRA